jgi:hypothetical protein
MLGTRWGRRWWRFSPSFFRMRWRGSTLPSNPTGRTGPPGFFSRPHKILQKVTELENLFLSRGHLCTGTGLQQPTVDCSHRFHANLNVIHWKFIPIKITEWQNNLLSINIHNTWTLLIELS